MTNTTKPDPPQAFDWSLHDYATIKGTEDWHLVTEVDSGSTYDWDILRVYYSPSARRYFWHSDGGCSCNGWSDNLESADDFENGDRAAAIRGIKSFGENLYHGDKEQVQDAISELRTYREPKEQA